MFVKFGKEYSPSFKKIEREAIQENHSDSFIRWVVEGLTLKFKSDTKIERRSDETKNQGKKRSSQNHQKPQGKRKADCLYQWLF